MKAIWDDLFFDIKESGLTEEGAATFMGKQIQDDIDRIERAIKDYDLKKALSLIWEMKKEY